MESHTPFFTTLRRYQVNLTWAKVTGRADYQTLATNDKRWLDSYLASLEQTSQAQKAFIQKFMTEYKTANPDLLVIILGKHMSFKLDLIVLQPIQQNLWNVSVSPV